MPKIPQNTIDKIRDLADIVDVISTEIELKRRGINYFGVCPFHDENTPSFSVSPSKQIYHCFGCGNGGNVFTFIMEFQKLFLVILQLKIFFVSFLISQKRM